MTDFTAHLMDMMHANMIGVYICLFIAPFFQEDAAVIGAASLSLNAMGTDWLIFAVIAAGLSASDLWKYWIGRAARTQAWAVRFAEKPGVQRAERLVVNRLGATLTAVRFIPGARIALYIAAGYFGASFWRFACWIIFTAALYIGLVFGLFHVLGMVAGEAAKVWAPAGALALLALVLGIQFARKKAR